MTPRIAACQVFLSLTKFLEFPQVHVHWISDAIQPISSSVTLFSFYLQSFPGSGSFLMSWLFILSSQSIGASASAPVLLMNIQDWFPSPCCPRDSQKSSPAPQFESINSLVLNLLYRPTFTSIHDYRSGFLMEIFGLEKLMIERVEQISNARK